MEIPTEEILADPSTPPDILTSGTDLLSKYGWYIFAGLVILGIYWNKIQAYLDRWYEKRESMKYAAKYHKNPDLALKHLEGMEKARQQMQEELNRKALEHQEKMNERRRKEDLEKIAKAEGQEGGNRLGCDKPSTSRGLKPDYNPLMGSSGSTYRPPKRGCPGGGCGK